MVSLLFLHVVVGFRESKSDPAIPLQKFVSSFYTFVYPTKQLGSSFLLITRFFLILLKTIGEKSLDHSRLDPNGRMLSPFASNSGKT
jgi:hypothetical protein